MSIRVASLKQVWDGTRCSYPLLTVPVPPEALEGGSPAVTDRQNLIANVLVYDNHVEVAHALKVRDTRSFTLSRGSLPLPQIYLFSPTRHKACGLNTTVASFNDSISVFRGACTPRQRHSLTHTDAVFHEEGTFTLGWFCSLPK